MKHQIIFENTSQTLVHVPPIYVTSATYKIELLTVSEDNADRVIASGAATADSLAKITSADAGPTEADPHKIPINITLGINEGTQYALAQATSSRLQETVEITTVISNQYALTKHPITRTYPSGANLHGIELSASFPDATAALEEYLQGEYPMRVVWEYTIDGTQYAVQDEIELVRFSAGDLDLSQCVVDMQDAWPTINSRLEHKGINSLMQAAEFGARRIATSLKAKNINPQTFLMGEQGRWCLMWSAFKHLAQFGISPGNTTLAEFKEDCEREYAETFNTMTVGYAGKDVVETDHDTDVASPKDQTKGPYRQIILRS